MAKQFSRIYNCKVLNVGSIIQGDKPDGKHYSFRRLCLNYIDPRDESFRCCEVLCNTDICDKFHITEGLSYDFRLTFENFVCTGGYLC